MCACVSVYVCACPLIQGHFWPRSNPKHWSSIAHLWDFLSAAQIPLSSNPFFSTPKKGLNFWVIRWYFEQIAKARGVCWSQCMMNRRLRDASEWWCQEDDSAALQTGGLTVSWCLRTSHMKPERPPESQKTADFNFTPSWSAYISFQIVVPFWHVHLLPLGASVPSPDLMTMDEFYNGEIYKIVTVKRFVKKFRATDEGARSCFWYSKAPSIPTERMWRKHRLIWRAETLAPCHTRRNYFVPWQVLPLLCRAHTVRVKQQLLFGVVKFHGWLLWTIRLKLASPASVRLDAKLPMQVTFKFTAANKKYFELHLQDLVSNSCRKIWHYVAKVLS